MLLHTFFMACSWVNAGQWLLNYITFSNHHLTTSVALLVLKLNYVTILLACDSGEISK